ncbi:hypothetical protein V8D89_012099 [Ganoderma adspersum]
MIRVVSDIYNRRYLKLSATMEEERGQAEKIFKRLAFQARGVWTHAAIFNQFMSLEVRKLIKSVKVSFPRRPYATVYVSSSNLGQDGLEEECTNNVVAIQEFFIAVLTIYVFGRDHSTVIATLGSLKCDLELVDALGDMVIATKLLSSALPRDPLWKPVNLHNANFCSLVLIPMVTVLRESRDFDGIEACTLDTHSTTSRNYGIQASNAFGVNFKGEARSRDRLYGLEVEEEWLVVT